MQSHCKPFLSLAAVLTDHVLQVASLRWGHAELNLLTRPAEQTNALLTTGQHTLCFLLHRDSNLHSTKSPCAAELLAQDSQSNSVEPQHAWHC